MKERGFVFQEENLLSPDAAVATFIERARPAPFGRETVALDAASGRILAQTIVADADYPDAPRSAMDGFALTAASTPGRLRVAGEIAMGSAWGGVLEAGSAVAIPTGGVVPDGADAVVPIEDVSRGDATIDVDSAIAAGANVNPRAGDMRKGETALVAGTRLDAPHVGVLATLGFSSVAVYRRPKFAVLSSGDELIDVGAIPAPGQIRDSNRFAIAAALRAMGADAEHRPTANDEPGALDAALRDALAECDGAVITGGSSVGERDQTPGAIAALGPPGVLVHGLRVKPGKPTVLAAFGSKPILGLPGNPLSAIVILEAVLAPVVAAYAGSLPRVRTLRATLTAPVRSRLGWTWYVPVSLQQEAEEWMAHPLPLRSSSVSLAARADGFIAVGEATEDLAAGTSVRVTLFL